VLLSTGVDTLSVMSVTAEVGALECEAGLLLLSASVAVTTTAIVCVSSASTTV